MDELVCLACKAPITRWRDQHGRLAEPFSTYRNRLFCDACRMAPASGRSCLACGDPLIRRRDASGRFTEKASNFARRLFCGAECSDRHGPRGTVTHIERRRRLLEQLERARGRALERRGEARSVPATSRRCFLCDGREGLLLHHKDGDWSNNAADNLTPICVRCRAQPGRGAGAGP